MDQTILLLILFILCMSAIVALTYVAHVFGREKEPEQEQTSPAPSPTPSTILAEMIALQILKEGASLGDSKFIKLYANGKGQTQITYLCGDWVLICRYAYYGLSLVRVLTKQDAAALVFSQEEREIIFNALQKSLRLQEETLLAEKEAERQNKALDAIANLMGGEAAKKDEYQELTCKNPDCEGCGYRGEEGRLKCRDTGEFADWGELNGKD